MSDWRVTLSDVRLPEADVDAVLETLRGGWLTMGPRTAELEEAFATAVGAEHAVAVSSGTAALHLACLAAGAGPGDEVIVPALAFVADAHAPRCCGAEPVLCDVRDLNDPTLDPAQVEARITPRTRAVIAVHMFGYPADLGVLGELCADRGLALIEDCAEAAGARLPSGASVGTAGLAGCFSLFSKTQLGVGEGGVVTSDDPAVAEPVRSLRSHAMTSGTWDRHRGHAETYDVTDLGFNYRLDEPRATLATRRLGRLDDAVARLREVVRGYRERLAGVEGVEVPFGADAVELSGHFAFCVLVSGREKRDAVRERLASRGVQTTFYPALTRLTEYAPGDGAAGCPVAEEFGDRHLALPLATSLDDAALDLVVGELGDALLQ